MVKKRLLQGLLKFIETRVLIFTIGAICFALFAQRGTIYHEKQITEIVNLKNVWDKFDSTWYQKLAKDGYPDRQFTDSVQETWGYMPFYSIIINLLSWLFGGNLFFTGLFVSNICTLFAIYVIYKIAQEKFETGVETITLLLTCAGSFYLSILYTEGLFVLLSALVFFLTNKKRYSLAIIIAGLASVTRIQGCILFIIPLTEIIRYHLRNAYKYIPALFLAVLPMVSLMFYLYKTCGEPLAFIKIQHAWGSVALYPLQGFVNLFNPNLPGSSLINIGFWLLILAVVFLCYRKLPASYIIFTVLYFLLSTSNEIVYGTTRYMLGVLPVFFAASLSPAYVRFFFYIINILFLAITICAFVTITPTFI